MTLIDEAAAQKGNTETGGGQTQDSAQAAAEGQAETADQTQARETQTQETQAQAGQAQDQAQTDQNQQQQKPAVPEQYQFKLPEGVQIDQKAFDAFTPVAKELGLTNEQAQKLVDLYASQVKGFDERLVAEHNARVAEWTKKAEGDAEYGGPKLAENMAVAKKALDTFATEDLRQFLDDTGLGNHPEVVRLFFRIGQKLKEDGFAEGVSTGKEPKSLAAVLYPSMK